MNGDPGHQAQPTRVVEYRRCQGHSESQKSPFQKNYSGISVGTLLGTNSGFEHVLVVGSPSSQIESMTS